LDGVNERRETKEKAAGKPSFLGKFKGLSPDYSAKTGRRLPNYRIYGGIIANSDGQRCSLMVKAKKGDPAEF